MKNRLFALLLISTFISCINEVKKSNSDRPESNISEENISDYKIKGDSIVSRTFDTLRNKLVNAIKENGFDGAVEFCNINALSLTNTYRENNLLIKRTSDKLRNPSNAPDSTEQRILSKFLNYGGSSDNLVAVVQRDASGNVHYFKPIILQSMCLNCHGNPQQIQPKTLASIQSKYPNDLATGYKEGELRGIWHLTFKK